MTQVLEVNKVLPTTPKSKQSHKVKKVKTKNPFPSISIEKRPMITTLTSLSKAQDSRRNAPKSLLNL